MEIKSLMRRNPALQMFHAYSFTLSEKLQRNRMMNSELGRDVAGSGAV